MIRIDEIYDSIFVPWALPRDRTGIHWFDPFGSTRYADLVNRPQVGGPGCTRYLFWDQEPIELESLATLAQFRAEYWGNQHLITSEKNSKLAREVCEKYGWQQHYYFFHGWAALDWYRGYDRSLLIQPPGERRITKTFIAANRIVGGRRQHRLKMLYYIFKYNLKNNYVSCPETCPVENQPTVQLAAQLSDVIYPAAQETFAAEALPLNMPGETGHPMHSCWLSLFQESAESLLYLVTETVADGERLHLTEKTFKPIALQMPFIIVGTPGSLEYLRSYGFRTFDLIWNESYDQIADQDDRIQAIADLLKQLDSLTPREQQALYASAQDIVVHNYQHFYSGAFEQILWQELCSMLAEF